MHKSNENLKQATWFLHMNVTLITLICPYCKHTIDLKPDDVIIDELELYSPNGLIVCCPECERKIEVIEADW